MKKIDLEEFEVSLKEKLFKLFAILSEVLFIFGLKEYFGVYLILKSTFLLFLWKLEKILFFSKGRILYN